VLSPKTTNLTADMQTITLPMPRIGFGVYKIHPSRCEAACLAALDAGYRHLDTAQLYRSEAQVASAVARSGVPRAEVFLTTKIKTWRGGSSEELYGSLLESVRRLGGEREDAYVDLFLVHTPWFKSEDARREVWFALERLKEEGRARAIGVSNYGIQHLEEMRGYAASWPPSVNQIEVSVALCAMPTLIFLSLLSCLTPVAPSLVSTERACQVLPGARYRHPGLQPAGHRCETWRYYAVQHRAKVWEVACSGAASVQSPERLGSPTEDGESRADAREF
jgi:hypothetical protein